MVPKAPGTAGSLAVVVGFLVLDWIGWMSPLLLAAVAVSSVGLNIALGGWIERFFATKDPSPVVIDEVAGQCVALAVPVLRGGDWVGYALAFFLFRIFDILKLFGARRLERLPRGWGMVLDDLLSGLYAALILGAGGILLTRN